MHWDERRVWERVQPVRGGPGAPHGAGPGRAQFFGDPLCRPKLRPYHSRLNYTLTSYIVRPVVARGMEPALTPSDPSFGRAAAGGAAPVTRPFAAGRSVVALMLREMSSRYGRTPGGYVWAILEPLGALIVLAVVFSLMLRSPPLGSSFILFYASGYLVYLVYANVSGQVQAAISFSKPLLMYPAVSWIDAILARFVLNLLTSIAVMAIVFFGIFQFTAASANLVFGPMVLAVVLSACLGLGIGTLNCLLVGLFPAWGQIWGIATRPLFLVAGVIFIYENMPPMVQAILWYTPWIHITGLFRTGVYPTYGPDYLSMPLVLVWIMVPLALGLLLLRRHHKDILNR